MSPTLTTFLFELANFLLLAALLGWLLFKPVRDALRSRQEAERERAAALEAEGKANTTARAELEAAWTAFHEETTQLREARLKNSEAEASAIVERAREEAERERERSQQLLLHLERGELQELSAAVATGARAAVARFLDALQVGDLDAALRRAAGRRLEAVAAAGPGAVLVESASPLDEAAQAELRRTAGPRATSVDFRVVPELGAGFRVTTARGLIDASAMGIAAHVEQALQTALAKPESETGG